MRRIRTLPAVVALLVGTLAPASVLAGTATAATTAPAPATTGSAPSGTTWLCLPGRTDDPCAPDLTTTRTTFAGHDLGVAHLQPARHPKIDCFYVYPTVSDQTTPNADLTVDPEERSIALFQAAQFSRVCRVFAPMYRQLTLTTINGTVTTAESAIAYGDVLQAWKDYLHRYNHGRGVVLIGHSQGSFILRKLLATQVDPSSTERRLLVSAILPGGNVTVKKGSTSGGDFRHIAACRSTTQVGCVMAWSTFDATPPADSVFGRTSATGLQVLCTDPAALGGGTGTLDPMLPSQPFAPGSEIAAGIAVLGIHAPAVTTAWESAPGAYRGRCSTSGGADVLRITPVGGAPVLHASPLPTWGLHLVDVNIVLGNLVADVAAESAAYHPSH